MAADDMLRIFSTFDSPLCGRDSPAPAEYLAAADEVVIAAAEYLAAEYLAATANDNLCRAEDVLQTAMFRLENAFRQLMIQNTVALENANCSMRSLSFASEAAQDNNSEIMEISDEKICRLIRPVALSELKAIADRMIAGGYTQKLCQVYSSVRRDILLECLSVLGADTVSIEEVQGMEWSELSQKMDKWTQALRLVVRVILAEEQRTCDLIFEESIELKEDCFSVPAKVCVMHLLKFGDTIVIGQRSPEKLFNILGMYKALSEVSPAFHSLFSGDIRDMICREAEEILRRLGQAIKETLTGFGNAIKESLTEFGKARRAGEIHPITRYVINYLKVVVESTDLLSTLLSDDEGDGQYTSEMVESMTPLARRVLLSISYLEANIEEKSKLYEDIGMQYVSLMNNGLYIVQKVQGSELMTLLGDRWVRRRKSQIRQYGTSYLRASWAKVLSFFNSEGLNGRGSSHGGASRTIIKERFKNFNTAFEEIYKTQTTWSIQDCQLRDELRISISQMVLPAYRSFLGRFGGMLESEWHGTRYVKYTPEDLETSLGDFFECQYLNEV